MRYPSDYIQIGAQKVGVEIVKTRRDDDFTFGESDPHAGKMSLYADLSPANAVDTVLHEVTHFLMCGLPISKKDDEYLANVVGRGLTQFIRDNPKWVRWFLRELQREEKRNA